MSNFTPTVERFFEFEGDKVRVVFRRLKRREVLASLVAEGTDLEKSQRVMDLLPGQVLAFNGLRTAEGADVPLGEAMDEQYFAPLIKEIIEALLKESKLGDSDAGKSPAPPAATLKD